MAQHDYNIANQSGADFRADLNNALLAIATVNSGSTEPSTTFAHQLWVDTSSSVLKIRNAADNAWVTTGVSITASNTFTGDLTGNVTGNLTGNVTGNVTGDLTGNADSADILTTARTISLSGDVVGSVSFDGSANVDIDTVVQINSITLGTDTTGDYVESMSGGTGVTVTGGTGEGSTPSIAIGQAVATTDNVTFNLVTATDEFVGDLDGAVRFSAKAGEALTKGDLVYVSGVSGDVPVVSKAKADDVSKMPVFGLAVTDANNNAGLQVATFGTLDGLDTSGVSEGQILYASTTAGAYTTTKPTGESSQIQNIGKVIRSHAAAGSIKIGGAGRSNDVPNLNNGKIFIGNGSNQAITSTLDTSIVVENTNLYYTTARANTDFDSRLATKDTGDLTEGSNLYYTTARVNSDFDTRLATKDTGDLSEGSNLYYTDARVNSAFDTRLATKDTDDVSEGTTNLYYTSGRANTDFDTRLGTKSTSDLAEGTNLYYTSARFDSAFTSKDTDDLSEGTTNLYYTTTRFDSAFGNKTTADLTENTNLYYTDTRANSAIDTRVTKAFVDALGIQASSVDANSVTLGTDTVGNYIQTITGTANKITVSGSGSESADITLSLPDDVQIADSLTVAGNLTVNGTLTSLDTTNLDIEDNLFQLNAGLTGSPVNDSGMLINRGTSDNSIFMWDESVDKFTMGLTTADGSATGNITLNSLGTLVVNVEGNLTGNVTGTVSSLSNHDTADLTEGTNLYYTQARFDSAFTAKSTTDLSEGSNLYYTDARFDTRLATKDTDDVSEGTSNLYYTSARFNSAFSGKSTSDLSEGTNLYYTSARANTDFDTRLATKDTGDLSEGSNLYYTDARVQAVSINNVVEDTTPQLGGDLASNGNDILFADNDKAIFGAGSDLQIYHDGSHSHLINATGDLTIDSQGDDLILKASDDFLVQVQETDIAIQAVGDGKVGLRYNNSEKLATTSTGIDVTGTATMDGLTVDGNSTFNTSSTLFANLNYSGSNLGKLSTDGVNLNVEATSNLFLKVNSATRAKFDGNGDISFYEDTGSTAKFFWDASAESLGIGTTSPRGKLDITGSDSTNGTKIISEVTSTDVSANNNASFSLYEIGTEYGRLQRARDGLGMIKLSALSTQHLQLETLGTGTLRFATNNTERMRIASDGSLSTPTLGTSNVRFGVNAGNSIVSGGNYNVVVGDEAGTAITTGNQNTAVGFNAMYSNTTGVDNVAVGKDALKATGAGTDGSYNVAVGVGSLEANTEGQFNVGIGRRALYTNTTADENTAVGYLSLYSNTTGATNTALGVSALQANTTASNNTAVGNRALTANTTGTTNTAVGSGSLDSNTIGSYNTGVGCNSLTAITTGEQNTSIGYAAGQGCTGASSFNVAVGDETLNTSGEKSYNTAIGSDALRANTTASNNTAVGYAALTANTTGTANTVMGSGAGDNATTGSDNTFVGSEAGDTVTTGYQNTNVGSRADSSATIANSTALGYNTNVTASNNVFIGNTSVSAIKGQVSFSTYSDERIKKDIKDTDLGLEFIKELKPRKYKRVAPKDYPEEFKDPNKDDLSNPDYIVDGLVAQEVKQTMDKLDVTFSGWDKDENTTKQSLEYPAFVPALIKAVQELSTTVDELKAEIQTLKGE